MTAPEKTAQPSATPCHATSPGLPGIAMFLVLAAFWLCLARYHGFFHDALLYMTMGLAKLAPANYANDLIFRFGSQGEFSLFPWLGAGLIRLLGLDLAAFAYTAAGTLLWLGGLLALARRLNTGWGILAGIACVVFFSRYYDAGGHFSFAEPFPTPRLFAEALSLFALVTVLARRYLATGVLLLAAVAFHPLMAAYALLIAAVLFLLDAQIALRLRLACGVAAALLVGALCVMRVSVFAGFLQPFDSTWYTILVAGGQDVLPSAWDGGTFCRLGFFALLLVLTPWLLHERPGRNAIFIGCAAFLLALWGLGSGWLHDRFITQLQPWRCAWLLQVLALLALGQLLTHLWTGNCPQRWLAAFLTTALLQCGFVHTSGAFALGLTVAGAAVYLLLQRVPPQHIERAPWNWLPFLVPLPQLLSNAIRAWTIRWTLPTSLDAHDWRAAAVWLACLLTLALIVTVVRHTTSATSCRPARLTVALGTLCLLGGLWVWSTPYLDARANDGADARQLNTALQQSIPPQAVVYAEPGLRWSWFVLQRSAYADIVQLSGVVFSRELAVEGLRRLKTLCNIGVPGCPTDGFHAAIGEDRNAFWQARIPQLCADPALDRLVLIGRIEGASVFGDAASGQVSLVNCTDARRQREVR